MSELYAIHELQHDIWEATMDHVDTCNCKYCVALGVIEEYLQ